MSSVAVGDEATAELEELAEYVDGHSVAFCTSSAWLRAAARHLPARPVLITVRSGGAPVALAALGVSHHRRARRIELLGGDLNDYGRFYYDDDRAAAALAETVASWVLEGGRWSLSLGQLSSDDAVGRRLAARLPGATVEPGAPIPQIVGIGADYRVSRNRRKKLQNATNRIENDGRTWEKVVVDDPAGLERWLPTLVEVRRRRDHASGRRSHLDDPAVLAFYETVVRGAVERGRAAIDLFLVDGQVAGFVVTMFDGDTHRLYDGRVAEEWQYYRGGMVCDLMAVLRAAEAPGVSTFDWLRGKTDAKFGNHEIHRVGLRAASHASITALDEWEGALRRGIKATVPDALVRRIVAR
ncbi:MAG TPA: GNAT family N-acetyltransferase [Nocardioides sp.]|nr:GNAT family N-acetyltransferase [Nocardioides sp.]